METIEIPDDDVCRRCECKCNDRSVKSYRIVDKREVLVDIRCDSCADFRRIEQYRKDSVLRTNLAMHAALWGYERGPYRGDSRMEELRDDLLARRSRPPLCVPEEQWTTYRRMLEPAIALLPGRHEQQPASWARVEAIRNAETLAIAAEKHCGLFDGFGNALPQPRSYEAVNKSMERVTNVMKTLYEPECWFGGLATFVRPEPVKGHSGEAEGLKMLSYCMCGRAMQTLSIGDASITVITSEDEDEPMMGIQGIEATEEQAVEILTKATTLWKSGALKLTRDVEVGFGF